MAQVTLKNVTKRFDDKVEAVHDLSFCIPNEQLVVLVGPSGCGKSTTLRMIAGLESVTSGEIRIGDRVVNHVAPKDRDIAMVFQSYALYPHMSVRKNLEFGLRIQLYLFHMHPENRDAPDFVGPIDEHLAIEATSA